MRSALDDWLMFLEKARFSIPVARVKSYAKRPLDAHIAAHIYGVFPKLQSVSFAPPTLSQKVGPLLDQLPCFCSPSILAPCHLPRVVSLCIIYHATLNLKVTTLLDHIGTIGKQDFNCLGQLSLLHMGTHQI